MKRSITAILATLLIGTPAIADWVSQKSAEDVFGNVNVTASGVGDNGTLMRFECGSGSEPFLAYLVRSDPIGTTVPARFLHVDQDGERHETDANVTDWNDKYIAAIVQDTFALRRVAEHMKVARKPIAVGITIPLTGGQLSDTFSPSGSTAASTTVLANCFKGTN